jgi:hypothetical protein
MNEAIDRNTRVIDLTVDDLIDVVKQIMAGATLEAAPPVVNKRLFYGIAGIAQVLNCSMTSANRIKKSGVINAAISQYGRKIVIDADKALELRRLSNLQT